MSEIRNNRIPVCLIKIIIIKYCHNQNWTSTPGNFPVGLVKNRAILKMGAIPTELVAGQNSLQLVPDTQNDINKIAFF